jgi:hypothetical protein
MPGACCTRGLVCKDAQRKRTRAYRYSRSNPAFPAQWSYGLCRALPGDEFVLSPLSRGLRFVQARLGRRISARRSISNGCQDHTVLPYAARLHQRPRRVWYPSAEVLAKADLSAARPARCCSLTENRPANTPHARRCCVHRIPSRVRDDRDPPLVRDETAGVLVLIWGDREGNCFCGRDWTGQITLNWLGKLAFSSSTQAGARGPESAHGD